MPQEPFRPTPAPLPGSWTRVSSAEEARRWEADETVRRPMAAIDYDRAQDERWAKLSPDLIEALDKLFGRKPALEPPPAPIVETVEFEIDYEGLADFYGGHFW